MNLDEQRQLRRCRFYSIGLLSIAFGIGFAGLLGWIFDSELLKRIHPTLVTMKANTAVCLMLAAVSLFLIEAREPSLNKRRISQLLAAIVATVGLLTLSEHLLGWNSGLDQLLFHETSREAGLSSPGRMGVAASLNFSLIGIALFFVHARSRRLFQLANISMLFVLASTLLVFLYYFYGVEQQEPFALYFTIAIHSVIAFLCLAMAILLARPERSAIAALLGSSPGAVVARRMWPAFLILILLGWVRTVTRDAAWPSFGFATASFTLAVLILLAGLIWWTA
ncbi:MAG TPA: hypothetical protein VHS05_06860, partial [Pyrinomonadaceae bacterium]|nr:hypothetical protein [Pyrinomonadaceae bacterium]